MYLTIVDGKTVNFVLGESEVMPLFALSEIESAHFLVEVNCWIPVQNVKFKARALVLLGKFCDSLEQQFAHTFVPVKGLHIQVFQEEALTLPG